MAQARDGEGEEANRGKNLDRVFDGQWEDHLFCVSEDNLTGSPHHYPVANDVNPFSCLKDLPGWH